MVNFDTQINKALAVYFRQAPAAVPASFRAHLSDELNAGKSIDQLLSDLFRSGEVQQRVLPLLRLYFAAFGRKADTAGLDWAANEMRVSGNNDPVAFVELLAGTPEYLARYPSTMTTTFFVQKLYTDLLGRSATAAERTAIIGYIDSGQWTRPGTVARFSNTPEFFARFDAAIESMLKDAFYNDPDAYNGTLTDHVAAA